MNTPKNTLKMSHEEWAKHLGVDRATVWRWAKLSGAKTNRHRELTLRELVRALVWPTDAVYTPGERLVRAWDREEGRWPSIVRI
jgi:hypothetical protein